MTNLAYIPNDYARGYVASQSDSRKGVHVPLSFIDLCKGNLHDAMLFAQIMYWHEPSKETGETRLKKLDNDGFLWLYKNHADWYKECRIKTQTVRKCLKRLEALGLIKYKLGGAEGNATPHIRIDWDMFEQRMKEIEQPKKPSKKIIQMPDTSVTVEHTPVTTEQGGLLQQDTPLLQRIKSNTENTTESISESKEKKKESAATPQADKKPLSPFQDTTYKGLYTVIAKQSFKFGEGQKIPDKTAKRIGVVVKAVMQLDPMPSVAEMTRVYQYDREVKSNISTPKGESTLVELVQEFRTSGDYKQYISDRNRVLSSLDSVSSAPAPTMAAIDAKLYHAPSQAEIDAMPDLCTPEEARALEDMMKAAVDALRFKKKVAQVQMPEGKAG